MAAFENTPYSDRVATAVWAAKSRARELFAGTGSEAILQPANVYWPGEKYEQLIPGATFTVREGPKIVGFGQVLAANA